MTKMPRRILKKHIKPLSVALRDQARKFYMTVGFGISEWAQMEGCLVQIVAKLLRTSEAKAGLVMYSINNFYVWITIIDELFVIDGTYKKSLDKWHQLVEHLKIENNIRVRLAHHSISQEERETEQEKSIGAYLRPGKFDTRNKSKKHEPLTMVEIVEFIGRVQNIHSRLISLLVLMKKRKSSR